MTIPDSPADALRFGVLHCGRTPEHWQTRCLQHLRAFAVGHPVVHIAPQPASQAPAHAWPSLPTVAIALAGHATGVAAVSAEALARLRAFRLDFIICFAEGELPAAILELPRHGVWRLQLGDWLNYRGLPGGFWEVYDHAAASAALLVRLCPDPDLVLVLREGYLRTDALSVRRNRERLLNRFAHWPAEVCRDLVRNSSRSPAAPARRARTAVRVPPAAWQRAFLALRITARIAATGYHSLFRHDQWNIGIIDRPIHELLTTDTPLDIDWLPPTPRAELRADPFGTLHEGRLTILCEYFSYRDNRGYIVAMDPAAAAAAVRVDIGPERAVHLSYPFLFEADGRWWCVPESSAAEEVALYEIERFPQRWTRSATLLTGQGLADASVFQYEGRWWLAASDVADKGANSELSLWFAESLSGPWMAHSRNPVKIDVRSARPAGAPFWADGSLYRPAQDCSSTYGARVIINRIVRLTPDEFCEEEAATVNPDPAGPYPKGLHTLSKVGDKTLVDGKRSVFVPAQFLRVLWHYLP